MKATSGYTVYTSVKLTVDESRFTGEFLEQFAASIYEDLETLEDHKEYLAEMFATGALRNGDTVDGYGNLKEFGISAEVECTGVSLDEN